MCGLTSGRISQFLGNCSLKFVVEVNIFHICNRWMILLVMRFQICAEWIVVKHSHLGGYVHQAHLY
jgi:hypothetical protein